MVWSRPEVKKIQYGEGGMVLDWLDFGGKGSLGGYIVGRAQVNETALYY
jgi:hypothetical protein